MGASNLVELTGLARELGLAAETALAERGAALGNARARLDRLRRYAADYRAECGVGNGPCRADELRRRHALVARLDAEVESLAATAARLERELLAAREERRRHRSSETALEVLAERSARAERAADARRGLDALDAACALRAAAAAAAGHRGTRDA